MTALIIPPDDRNLVRVFDVTLPKADVAALTGDPAMTLLGVDDLLTRWATLLDIADLGKMPLSDFLLNGEDLVPDAIAPDRARLDSLTDYVLIVGSRAFDGVGATLDLGDRLSLIGTYPVMTDPAKFEPLPADGARKSAATAPAPKPARSDAAIGGRIAVYVLVGAAALVWLMIWIAG